MNWDTEAKERLIKLWPKHSVIELARMFGTTPNSIIGESNRLHLQYHGRAKPLADTHPAVVEAHSKYPSRVQVPLWPNVPLKSGANQRKLGPTVLKGAWKGKPIFSLSLEERSTCPRYCTMWNACYGNSMRAASRYSTGTELIVALTMQLANLENAHPGGFVVRLHLLGDFYSVRYVMFWADMLDKHLGLHIFGYTARAANDPIGEAINELRDEQWDRFAIRTSDGPVGQPRTMVVDRIEDVPKKAILCPAQRTLKKPVWCGSCALCWGSKKDVAFLRH